MIGVMVLTMLVCDIVYKEKMKEMEWSGVEVIKSEESVTFEGSCEDSILIKVDGVVEYYLKDEGKGVELYIVNDKMGL